MSNFAERLVARSVGSQPGPGIAMLAPRAASRFEPLTTMDLETFAEIPPARALHEPPAVAAVRADAPVVPAAEGSVADDRHAPWEAVSPVTAHPVRNEDFAPEPTRSAGIADLRPQLHRSPLSDMREDKSPARASNDFPESPMAEMRAAPAKAAPRSIAAETALARPPAPPDAEASDWDHGSRRARTPAAFERSVETPARSFDVSAVTAAAGIGDAASAQNPAISIGKIEVQFLPREPQAPAARPQPQRTRGFDAYARARRGEPR